ncbi:MAG TPA: hypothetical protein VF174_15605 [Micromonosporaceae bacterium]
MTHEVSRVLSAAMIRLGLGPDEREKWLDQYGGAQSVDELPERIRRAAGGLT